jgi:IclR family mhp operon transcriptional activator
VGPRKTVSDAPIRSVVRALAVLQTMNTAQRWTLHDLHLALKLPKSTLFRILDTLAHEGYVKADAAPGHYTLKAKVKRLSDGFAEQSQVVEAGASIAVRVTREIKWPLAIGVIDGNAIEVGFSTMPYSPLAVHTTTVGRRLSLAHSAMGLVYLAHCSSVERDSLLELMRADNVPTEIVPDYELAQIADAGYAVRHPGPKRDSATLAVPILQDGRVLGSLGMTTFGRTMSKTFVTRHLPIMRDTANEIGCAYSAVSAPARP